MKKIKKIDVFSEKWPSIPEKSDEFFKYWQEKIDMIPEEFRESSSISIDTDTLWDDIAVLEVTVSYSRLETDEEESLRESQEKEREEAIRNEELHELAMLKKKYGDL